MKTKYTILLYLFIVVISLPVCNTNNNIIVYGKNCYSLNIPRGWFFSKDASREYHFLYCIQQEERKDEIQTIMYSIAFDRNNKSNETIIDFIDGDQLVFKKNNPGLIITKISNNFSNIKKDKHLTGKYYIYEYSGFKEKYKEIMIYIDLNDTVCIIVFSAKNKKDYQKYYNDFISVVDSFHLVGNDIDPICGEL